MENVDYSEKSFVVWGPSTKKYRVSLKELGGRFNKFLKSREGFEGGPGWIFSKTKKSEVSSYVQKVKEHEESPTENGIPTVVIPSNCLRSEYQTVRWRVYKPAKGMNVLIKAHIDLKGKVVQTLTHNDVVDTAYVDIDGKTSVLVICNGSWQIKGLSYDHKVFFNP